LDIEMPGFQTRRAGNCLLLTRGPLSDLLASGSVLGLLTGGQQSGSSVEGRRSHAVIDLPGGGKAVARHYAHGGLLRSLTGDRFFGAGRFASEVRVSEHLRARGVNTPEVLGLLVRFAPFGFCRGHIVTRMVEGGRDLLLHLSSRAGKEQMADPRRKREFLRTAAEQVRKMHDAGVYHADIHIKNLLLGPGGAVYILDLDRASIQAQLKLPHRVANLLRLGRSLEKTGTDSIITGRDCFLFLIEYLRCGEPLDIEPRRVVKKYRRHVGRHRLLWKLGIG